MDAKFGLPDDLSRLLGSDADAELLAELGFGDALALPEHGTDIVILDATGEDRVVLPDVAALLKSTYIRAGSDLALETADGGEILILNYFASDAPPILESPGGARLKPDVVERLAGPQAPGQYAQGEGDL